MITVTGTWGKNSTDTYQDCEDVMMKYSYAADPDYDALNSRFANFDGRPELPIGRNSYGSYEFGLMRFHPFDYIPYANVQDARLRVYCTTVRSSPTLYIRRVFKPWVENEATYALFNYSVAWGAEPASYGSDSATDDGIYDVTASNYDSVTPTVTGTWYEFDVTSLVQQWINKEAKQYGIRLAAATNTYNLGSVIYSSDGPDGYRPHLKIVYTVDYYFSGVVTDQGSPAAGRTIVAHKRDTFEPIAYTTTSGDGSYYMLTTYSGSHYIVCLDDDAGAQYNDKILGRMVPKKL